MSELIDPLLSNLALVVRVADSGGFSAASALTRIPQATVSRRIAALEEKLETRLFDRTTRKVALTQSGRRIYEHAKLMVQQGEAAASAVQALKAHPSGTLRITSTVVLGQAFVQVILAQYMLKYPEVSVKLELTGRRVDIIEEGFDIAIRVGRLPDSGLALTRLGTATSGFFASPRYLEARQPISAPEHLLSHAMFLPSLSLDQAQISLSKDGFTQNLDLSPRMTCNEFQPILSAALNGLGIAQLPRFVAANSIASHQLVAVLTDWDLPKTEISGLTPSYRGTLPAVREFLTLAKEQLKNVT